MMAQTRLHVYVKVVGYAQCFNGKKLGWQIGTSMTETKKYSPNNPVTGVNNNLLMTLGCERANFGIIKFQQT